MNPLTNAIGWFEDEKDAKKAGHTVKLTHQEANALIEVPRPERAKKLRELRKHKRATLRKERAKARAKK